MSRRSFVTASLALVALLALGACDISTTKKPGITAAGTQAYLQNLALAHFAFDRAPDDLTAASPYLARLNSYAIKKNVKPATTLVVALSFKTDDDGHSYKLMVPVSVRATEFGGLSQVVHLLAAHKPEYRTIHIRSVTLATREPVVVAKGKTSEVVAKVNDLYDTVVESATVPSRLDAARLQIALTRFFLHNSVRDAAYVSLENAKELLAGVDTSRQEDANEVQALSKELESLENALHKKLPYTF